MTKRLIFLLLIATLLCSAALAETPEKVYDGEVTVPDRFTFRWVNPQGYTVTGVEAGDAGWIGDPGYLSASIVPADEEKNNLWAVLVIARDERYVGVENAAALDQAALAEIEEMHRDESGENIVWMNTVNGNQVLVARQENEEGFNFVEFYTVCNGYEIKLSLKTLEETIQTPIEDADIAMIIQFLCDMEFVPV